MSESLLLQWTKVEFSTFTRTEQQHATKRRWTVVCYTRRGRPSPNDSAALHMYSTCARPRNHSDLAYVLYMCKAAESFGLGLPLRIYQGDIPAVRRIMMLELHRGQFVQLQWPPGGIST